MKKNRSKWSSFLRKDGIFDFEALTPEQKEEFYQECEQVGKDTPTKPLTAYQKALHRRVAKRGRPRVGLGSLRWNVSLEKSFARQIDAYAKNQGISRSKALADGARLLLSSKP